jgi:monothiol glutaredoxin
VRERIAKHHAGIVAEVQQAIAAHPVVVVGMAMNPFPRKARRLLDGAGISHHYLAYGSYLSQWRPRNALKMWTGWPTFPMVFVNGVLIGGANDLEALITSGELKRLLTRALPA